MLMTKCVDDNYKMLVTIFASLVANIQYLDTLASGINNQNMSSLSKFWHQIRWIVSVTWNDSKKDCFENNEKKLNNAYAYDSHVQLI